MSSEYIPFVASTTVSRINAMRAGMEAVRMRLESIFDFAIDSHQTRVAEAADHALNAWFAFDAALATLAKAWDRAE